MNQKLHSVKYNFIMNFILTASNFIFPLITFPYVSRILLASGNGKVNFAASVANYFMMVASLGIPTYGIRACAKVRDDKEALSKTVQEILIINFVSTALVTLTYLVCIFTVPKFAQDKILYLIEGINIVLNMLGVNWLYQALEQYDYITARSVVFKFISMILMFIFVQQQKDYRIYAAITVLAAVGSNVLNFVRLRRFIVFKKFKNYEFKKHLKPIFILFAQNVTVSIYTNLDTVMLGFMKSDEAVGLYTAAVKVKGVLLSIVASLGNVLLPRMSYYVKKNAKEKFYQLLRLALNAELFMAFPLAIYFSIESSNCILLLAGKGYLGAIPAMEIITVAIIPTGLTGVIGIQTLTPLNREKQVLYSVVVGAVSDFVLNLILIPEWGAAGAALATTIAEYLVLLVQIILASDILKNVAHDIHLIKYGLITAASTFPTLIITQRLHYNVFINLVITAFVFYGIYAVILFIVKDELLYRVLDNKMTRKFLRQ
jgi:O-antigen/teichoic acid export membrane protein